MLKIDLSHRIAVVTGGAGELGRTICRTLADCGAAVAVHYRSKAVQAADLAQEIRDKGGRAEAFGADVTKLQEVLSMRDQIIDKLGAADVIVTNAVIQYNWTTVLEQAPEDYEGQFRSCVMQNVHMAKAFVPEIIEKGKGGRVIGINTECAMQNFPTYSAYTSGKRGMDGVLRVLAKEIGEHEITVNQVAPGWTRSDRIRAMDHDPQVEYASRVPMKRVGTDQEIANVVAFLASDLASYITGAYVPVCGGNVMPAI